MEKNTANLCAQKLKAIGDETRIKILEYLFKGPQCGTDLARKLNLSQARIAHHIAILKSARLIAPKREGQRVNYDIHPEVRNATAGKDDKCIDLGCCQISF